MALRARKRFGQHFLHDPAVIERIARTIRPQSTDRLVEIGPGRGALTRELLRVAGVKLDAIEIDRDLAAQLRADFDTRLTVHANDALDFDFTALAEARGGKLRILGNLPYNISTPLLFHLLAHAPAIEDIHVMLQREVVNRMAASPGSGEYGRLTVMLAPWVHIERLFDIGPGAFVPAPRVWSAVAHLEVRSAPAFAVSPHFAAVVAAAFAHRRKTLRNALKGVVAAELIAACNLDGGLRPDAFAPEEFNMLARRLD